MSELLRATAIYSVSSSVPGDVSLPSVSPRLVITFIPVLC